MSNNHWPLYVDQSRDESKRILRRLELEAYSSLITAFRAQGDLTRKKNDVLQQLQKILSISTERHRAEVRRATNDEELTTIAANMTGPDVSSEWQVEGRRLIPLLPRLVPQTAFTLTANSAANLQAEKNSALPSPSMTSSRDVGPAAGSSCTPPSASAAAAGPKMPRPASPNSNVVVLPSGMSIHIKGLTEDEDTPSAKKRRRSSSSSEGSILVSKGMPVVSTSSKMIAASMSAASSSLSTTPMKITFTKSPVKSQTTITPSQKVILVSSSQAGGGNILQRSLNMPVVKATSAVSMATASSSLASKSVVMSTAGMGTANNGSLGSIITVASSANTITTTTGSSYLSGQNYITSTIKPRTKTITTRHRAPNTFGRGSRVIPVGGASGPVHPSPQGLQNMHIKPVVKPTIHIKQEGGMKIITQGIPQTANKILPKPLGSGKSPVVVMTTVASPGISMVTKSAQGSPMGSRVLNITTQGRVIARATSGNVVTVNPKTLQLTAIKGAGGTTVLTSGNRVATATGTKPNVIVVQKAQARGRGAGALTPTVIKTTGSTNSPFEKELVSFIQRQDSHKATPKTVTEKKLIAPKPSLEALRKSGIIRQRSDSGVEGNKSSLLAELIHAVGIVPQESGAPVTQEGGVPMQEHDTGQERTVQPSTSKGGHQWVEYDVPVTSRSLASSAPREGTTAIKALLDLRPSIVKSKLPARSTPIEYGEQEIQQSEIYTIDAEGNLIPQTDKLVTSSEDIEYMDPDKPAASEEVLVSIEGDGDFAQQVTNLGGEILGELDPQTGIFYSASTAAAPTISVSNAPQVIVSSSKMEKGQTVVVTTSSKQMDFLTSALSQANIDLDSYQFIEEDEPVSAQLPASTGVNKDKLVNVPEKANVTPMMSLLTQQPVTVTTHRGDSALTHQSVTVPTHRGDATVTHQSVTVPTHRGDSTVTHQSVTVPTHRGDSTVTHKSVTVPTHRGDSTVTHQSVTVPTHRGDSTVSHQSVTVPTHRGDSTVTHQSVTVPTHKGDSKVTHQSVTVPTHRGDSTVTHQSVTVPTHKGDSSALTHQSVTVPTHRGDSTATPQSGMVLTDTGDSTATQTKHKDSAVTPQSVMVLTHRGDSALTQTTHREASVTQQSIMMDTQRDSTVTQESVMVPTHTSEVTVTQQLDPDLLVASDTLVTQEEEIIASQPPSDKSQLTVDEQLAHSQLNADSNTYADDQQVADADSPQESDCQQPLQEQILSEIRPSDTPTDQTNTAMSEISKTPDSPRETCEQVEAHTAPVAQFLDTREPLQFSATETQTPNSREEQVPSDEAQLQFAREAVTSASGTLPQNSRKAVLTEAQTSLLSAPPSAVSTTTNTLPKVLAIPKVKLQTLTTSQTAMPTASHIDVPSNVTEAPSVPSAPSSDSALTSILPPEMTDFVKHKEPQTELSKPQSVDLDVDNVPDVSVDKIPLSADTLPLPQEVSSVVPDTASEGSTVIATMTQPELDLSSITSLQQTKDDALDLETLGGSNQGDINMETPGSVTASQHLIDTLEGPGVMVAYQPSGEVMSFTGQSEYMDHTGDHTSHHDAYGSEYDDPLASPSAGGSSEFFDDPSTPLRNSKRKRKAPRAPDESPPPTPQTSWVKHAVGLLLKVSRFRGNKEKGEPNASIWFLEPVNAKDVPDYYDIIKNPMDFSTIKRKLESGVYATWKDFHGDMMLVKENCFVYNSPGSVVRSDCSQVFAFYAAEYSKAREKWHRSQMGSPTTKKFRIEKSPVH